MQIIEFRGKLLEANVLEANFRGKFLEANSKWTMDIARFSSHGVDKRPIEPVKWGGGAAKNSRQAFAVAQPFLGKAEHDVDGVTCSSAADRSA
jgi:hypothetical protein